MWEYGFKGMSKEFFTLATLADFRFLNFKFLKWKFLRLIFLVTYYKNLNSCAKGVEILASAISVPITNLNNIIIIIKNFAFALTIYYWSNKSIALIPGIY